MRKKNSILNLRNGLYFFSGFTIGVILIWPGVLSLENRKCILKIIKDGSDGKVSIGTVLSIEPNRLLKIKNTKNIYNRVLLIGDQCFRD